MTQARHTFTDEQWSRGSAALPARKGRPGLDDRAFLSGVLWIAKTGAPWRDLPDRYGHWAVVYQRYARWCRAGVFEAVFKALQEPDLEEVQIDSTHCRAHQAGLGAQKKTVLSRLDFLLEA